MLTRLYIDNYKALTNFELKLDPMNLVVGENGGGKSTAFEAVDLIRRFAVGGDRADRLFRRRSLTRWDRRLFQTFEVDLREGESEFRNRLKIEFWGPAEEPRVVEETLLSDHAPLFEARIDSAGMFSIQLFRDDSSKGPPLLGDWTRSGISMLQERRDNQKLVRFRRRLERVYWVMVNPFAMDSRSDGEDTRPASTLANLASWYRHCLQEDAGFYNNLSRDLREAMSGFEDLVLERVGTTERDLRVRCHGEVYALTELSEGQRALLALYLLLHRAALPGHTLLLDEPENFITLREMQPWLAAIRDQVGDGAQVVLVSHHPEFIDQLAVDCGLVFDREDNGPVRWTPWAPQTSELHPSELLARGAADERR